MTDDPIHDALKARADEHEAVLLSGDDIGEPRPSMLLRSGQAPRSGRNRLAAVAAVVLTVAAIGAGAVFANRADDTPVATNVAANTGDDAQAPTSTTTSTAPAGSVTDAPSPAEEVGSDETDPARVLVANGSSRCGAAGNFVQELRGSHPSDLDVLPPANAEPSETSAVFAAAAHADLADRVASLMEPKVPVGNLTDDVLRSVVPGWTGETPNILVILGQNQGSTWGGCDGTTNYGPPADTPSE